MKILPLLIGLAGLLMLATASAAQDKIITNTLGMKLMYSLAEQIGGTLSIGSDNDGTAIRVRFPLS